MIKQRLTRRQFFQVSAFGAAAAAGLPAIGLAAVAAAPTLEAQAAAEQPDGPTIPQPTFNPIASNTTFGALTDISMGWDGTLWGIDGLGAPHIYDPINDVWAQHGDSIDAAFVTSDGSTGYVFKDNEVVKITMASLQAAAPTTIAAMWPTLPDSFKSGVMGASGTANANVVILYNAGRFAATDGSIPATKLTDISGWPQTPTWKDGIIDSVVTIGTGIQTAYLIRSGEYIIIDPVAKAVMIGPSPYNPNLFIDQYKFPPEFGSGFDAATEIYSGALSGYSWFFKGTTVVAFYPFTPEVVQIKYIGSFVSNWSAAWHPVLQHAPNGRDGSLWAATTSAQGNAVIQHNGESWTQLAQQADHVGVGQDNTVVIASGGQLLQFDGQQFNSISNPAGLVQVSLGNAGALYARDSSNNVYNFDQGNVNFVTDVSPAIHIAVSNDGSIWHAKQSDANMNRLIVGSSLGPQAIPVKQGIVASVSKVAGTGFGAAHCLTQDGQGNTQLYRYDSPYVFKTGTSYGTGPTQGIIEQGGGLLYFTAVDTTAAALTQLVALDAHTGAEIARNELTFGGSVQYGQPVFDPLLNLIYVATAPIDPNDGSTGGTLLGLDARTLVQKWAFFTPAGIDAAPVLTGSRLFVSDRTGTTYLINTYDALANPFQVPTVWTVNPNSFRAAAAAANTTRVSAPLVVDNADGLIYTSSWAIYPNGDNQTWNVVGFWSSYHSADGSEGPANTLINIGSVNNPDTAVQAPVYGQMNVAPSGAAQLAPAVFYNCYNAVVGVSGTTTKTFTLPTGDFINTGFAYDRDANTLWFGTLNGVLYCLDTNLNPINNTPHATANSTIETTPVVYTDTKGNKTVYFNAFVPGASGGVNSLLGFDPDGGNVLGVATGATQVKMMSDSVADGTIYVGGRTAVTNDNTYPQVFGIRVDGLAQGVRDFIIESQLMQDPQDPGNGGSTVTAPDGNVIPSSVVRYQTHLTVVDDKKHPLANEPVKIWADIDGTVININGAQYTIGSADSAYAAVQTGVDGCVVITINATNTNASALRVWAPFMDPFERIVVYPDHEFHGRAAQSNANGSVADPAKPNLNTAYSYSADPNNAGTAKPLFTSDEKSQGTPTNVANAVSQMNAGLQPGGNSAASVAKALKTIHASDSAAPYVAYTDLGGMHYGPNNARIQRTATITAPFGFQLNKPKSGTHTYTPLLHSDARNAIDALTGTPWDPNNPNGTTASNAPVTYVIRRSDNIFTDFWNWLVGAINKLVSAIENVIVSVAEDIMVGINYFIGEVEYVFKAIIKVIEDVCNAIGSFFVQLLKAIEEVLEALSVLFHFGEIIWTHRWLASQLAAQKDALKTSLVQTFQPGINGYFLKAKTDINNAINAIEGQINPQQSYNSMPGGGSTPHSAMTAGPDGAGNTGSGSSQAVQGGWGVQTMKSGFGSKLSASSVNAGTRATSAKPPKFASPAASDDVTKFINDFLSSITGTLSNDFSTAQSTLSDKFSPNSASSFFSGLLTVLLELLKDSLDAAIDISQAMVDGLLDAIGDVVDAIWGAITFSIDFPVISWLYHLLFNEDLTLLNLATLVAAIPVTIIYRVVAGEYPQDSNNAYLAQLRQRGAGPQKVQDGILPVWQQHAIGTSVAILDLIYGLINAFNDFMFPLVKSGVAMGFGPLIGWLGNLATGIGLALCALTVPSFTTNPSDISPDDWGVYGFSCVASLMSVSGLSDSEGNSLYGLSNEAGVGWTIATAIAYTILLIATVVDFKEDNKTDVNTDLNFASSIISCLPSMVNPIKYIDEELALLDSGVDLFSGVATCALTMAATWHQESAVPRLPKRLYFPWVAFNPAPIRATVSQPSILGSATP